MGQPTNISKELLKTMGLKESQLDNTKVSTSKKTILPSTKTDFLKVEARKVILDTNAKHGQEVRFQCLQRDGKTKEGEPKYKLVNQQGMWTIDKLKDGSLVASRVHHYTESFKIVDYTIVGSNSDTKK